MARGINTGCRFLHFNNIERQRQRCRQRRRLGMGGGPIPCVDASVNSAADAWCVLHNINP